MELELKWIFDAYYEERIDEVIKKGHELIEKIKCSQKWKEE